MTDGPKKVSLCMLTYNRADELGRSLDSLLDQTYQNFELIINDDASTDRTEEVCRSYEERDSRVRYVRNQANLRYAGNNNAAIRRASCEYVGLVHDGDLYEPFMLERWVEALNAHPSAAFVFHSHYRKTNGEPLLHGYPPLVEGHDLLDDMLKRWDSPVYGIAMVRKSCVRAVGTFNTSFPRLADVDMWMRLLNEYDAAYVNEPLVRYAPRESGHELKGVNWDANREIMEIRRINIQRRFSEDPVARSEYMRAFERDRNRRLIRDLGWCVKRGRWNLAREGARRLEETNSVSLRLLGRYFGTVASFFSGSSRP